mgnify:CR=1 FL=1
MLVVGVVDMFRSKVILCLCSLLLCGCSFNPSNSSSVNEEETKVLNLMPSFKQKLEESPNEILFSYYNIIGYELYIQNNIVLDNGAVNSDLFNSRCKKQKEDFSTRYGGTMYSYKIDQETISFWDNYLFIQGPSLYKGDFYEVNRKGDGIFDNSEYRKYKSFRIDTNKAFIDGDSKNYVNEFKTYTFQSMENSSIDTREALVKVDFGFSQIFVYSKNTFSHSRIPNELFILEEGQSFSFIK